MGAAAAIGPAAQKLSRRVPPSAAKTRCPACDRGTMRRSRARRAWTHRNPAPPLNLLFCSVVLANDIITTAAQQLLLRRLAPLRVAWPVRRQTSSPMHPLAPSAPAHQHRRRRVHPCRFKHTHTHMSLGVVLLPHLRTPAHPVVWRGGRLRRAHRPQLPCDGRPQQPHGPPACMRCTHRTH